MLSSCLHLSRLCHTPESLCPDSSTWGTKPLKYLAPVSSLQAPSVIIYPHIHAEHLVSQIPVSLQKPFSLFPYLNINLSLSTLLILTFPESFSKTGMPLLNTHCRIQNPLTLLCHCPVSFTRTALLGEQFLSIKHNIHDKFLPMQSLHFHGKERQEKVMFTENHHGGVEK